MKLELRQTCGACPEQYDVYLDGEEVGYIRHRHGVTQADCPFGTTVYESEEAMGDGCFLDGERDQFLGECCEAILGSLGHLGRKTDNYWISYQ